ncbi:MAG: PAS domain S-box protein [Actinomycetota bacterium]|nr:PAS domain S-box protein [Actinomycetota bacterium]
MVDNQKTRKKNYEEIVKDKTFLLASIVENSDDGIITKTSKGIITSWNSGAERIYGDHPAKDLLGRVVSLLIPPGHTNEVPAILNRIKQGERISQTISQAVAAAEFSPPRWRLKKRPAKSWKFQICSLRQPVP